MRAIAGLRRLLARRRQGPAVSTGQTGSSGSPGPYPSADLGDNDADLVVHDDGSTPGRAHLVLTDGRVVEPDLDDDARARLEYLARRAVAPPPPRD